MEPTETTRIQTIPIILRVLVSVSKDFGLNISLQSFGLQKVPVS